MLVLLLAALLVRLLAVGAEGHASDVAIIARWAETLADGGPARFYDESRSVYPALLYLYWPMGLAWDASELHLAIKAASIPFDLAIGAVLFAVTGRFAGERAATLAAALYLFNPGVVLAGPIWGQVDAAGTLCFIGALIAVSRPNHALAAGLAVLAGLIKPQFGLVVLPVAFMVIRDSLAKRSPSVLLRAVVAAAAVYLAVALPLGLTPWRFFDELRFIAEHQPYASLYAPNPWGVLFGYEASDAGLAPVGAGLLVAGLVISLLPLRRGRDMATLLCVGALLVFAFYFLPTRVHERYLFPALALLAPFAARSARWLLPYVGLTLGFSASLVYQLATTSPDAVAPGLARLVLLPGSVPIQGLVLVGSAITITWLVWRESSVFASAPRG